MARSPRPVQSTNPGADRPWRPSVRRMESAVTLNRIWRPPAYTGRSWMSHVTVPRNVDECLRHKGLWFGLYESCHGMCPKENFTIVGTVTCLARSLTSRAEVAIIASVHGSAWGRKWVRALNGRTREFEAAIPAARSRQATLLWKNTVVNPLRRLHDESGTARSRGSKAGIRPL